MKETSVIKIISMTTRYLSNDNYGNRNKVASKRNNLNIFVPLVSFRNRQLNDNPQNHPNEVFN